MSTQTTKPSIEMNGTNNKDSKENTTDSKEAAATSNNNTSNQNNKPTATTTDNNPATTTSTPSSEISSVSHPLEHKWNFYYSPPAQRPPPGQAWQSNVKLVYSFNTVEDFWRLYNVLKSASALNNKTDYYLFKEGIQPEWEHEANSDGGRWSLAISKKDAIYANNYNQKVDDTWLYLILACIGEQFTDSDEVNGIVVGKRQTEHRFAIWTRNHNAGDALKRMGTEFKQFVSYNQTIGYEKHNVKEDKYTA